MRAMTAWFISTFWEFKAKWPEQKDPWGIRIWKTSFLEDFLSIIVGGGDLPNLVLKCCDNILVYFSFQQIYSK